MNFLYKTLIFLFFLFSNAYPQFYADSVVSDYVIEFMKIADESITYRSEYKNPKEYAEGELEYIAELYFYCYDKDPVGYVCKRGNLRIFKSLDVIVSTLKRAGVKMDIVFEVIDDL